MDRFWSKVEITGLYSCWNWTSTHSREYGMFKLTGQRQYRTAHSVAYTLIYGEIPEGHDVHHECENKGCVNPLHLQAMTRSDHFKYHRRRRPVPRKTHCKRGHERTPGNLSTVGNCKKCLYITNAARLQRIGK